MLAQVGGGDNRELSDHWPTETAERSRYGLRAGPVGVRIADRLYSPASGKVIDLAVVETPAPKMTTFDGSDGVLRLAVAPVYSPQTTLELYQALADYLGRRLNRPAELVQGKTYDEINDLIRAGGVTVAIVCTNAYLEGQEDF